MVRWVVPSCLLSAAVCAAPTAQPAVAHNCAAWLDQTLRSLHSSQSRNLCEAYAGKALLIVNTASYCGYTPQFKELEALHQRYRAQGLVVIGFPSDDFWQEASDESKTARLCFVNYGVTFDRSAPISVRGAGAHPLFRELAHRGDGFPRGNFHKYLVDADGNVAGTSRVAPQSEALRAAIERVLRQRHE